MSDNKEPLRQRLEEKFPTIAADILKERHRQISKWGDSDYVWDKYIRIMGEEFGEACEAIEDHDNTKDVYEEIPALQHLRDEVVQVAAVAARMIQNIDRRLGDCYAAQNCLGSSDRRLAGEIV